MSFASGKKDNIDVATVALLVDTLLNSFGNVALEDCTCIGRQLEVTSSGFLVMFSVDGV